MAGRVLVISASVGAGHDGAAQELCRRLEAVGVDTRAVDFLGGARLTGWLIRWVYGLQLKLAPWSYEATYRLSLGVPLVCRPLSAILTVVFGRRLRAWAHEHRATAVVSTYPLASTVLGRLRRRRRRGLPVPAITFITDFAVHPLWVHPGIDLNLCVHEQVAAEALKATGRPASAPGPLVSERFREAVPSRDEARERLGLPGDARVVLAVAGSWGVGDLEKTFATLAASGRYLPVAVCGTNERLRRRLEARGGGIVLGWTDAMPTLMAAADVLVQNAGGLTCMEAFAAGLPAVSYRPIAGHGRQNALDMDKAGVAPFASAPGELLSTLDMVIESRATWSAKARAMFAGDAAADVALRAAASPLPAEPEVHRTRRRVLAAIGSVAALYAALTVGADAATAYGIGAAHPAPHSDAVYLAARIGRSALDDPAVARALLAGRVTAVVDGSLAASDPAALARMAHLGVGIANGGWSAADQDLHVLLVTDDVTRSAKAIRRATGSTCTVYVSEQGVNAFDLAWARAAHEYLVRATRLDGASIAGAHLGAGHSYVLDALGETGPEVIGQLARIRAEAGAGGLATEPLAALR